MKGASCNPPGFGRTSPSLELKKVQQPKSEQENKPPSDSLHSLAPNFSRDAHLSKLSERQGSSSSQQEQQACSTSKSSSRVHPPRRPLQPLTIDLPGVNASSSGLQPRHEGGEAEEKQILASVFQFPPPLHHNQPFHHAPLHHVPYQNQAFPKKEGPVTCVVEQEGHLCLQLRSEVTLDISPNMSMRLSNPRHETSLALSGCGSQLAMVHPVGRLLQYGSRIEVQVEDKMSVKNAKVHPKGVSFTANNMALVYLLDDAGARSTSDMFHDLHASHIVNTLFLEVARLRNWEGCAMLGVEMLETAQYWRDNRNCDRWRFGEVEVAQTRDGLVTVQRMVEGEALMLRVSPNNGKVRFDSKAMQVTASLGEEAHLFLRARDRRLHYSGQSTVFTVRNGGHSAGFDEEGALRIF